VGVRIALSNAQRDEYLKRVPETSSWNEYVFEYLFSLTRSLETTDVQKRITKLDCCRAAEIFHYSFVSAASRSRSPPRPRTTARARSFARRSTMSAAGARLWESLASKPGRAVFFPNIPLRLVAPTPEAAAKGLSVVTFITVPSTSKVRVEKSSRRKPPRRELERAAADPRGSRLATRSLLSDARPHAPHRPDRACIVFPHRAPPPPPPRRRRSSDGSSQPFAVGVRRRGG